MHFNSLYTRDQLFCNRVQQFSQWNEITQFYVLTCQGIGICHPQRQWSHLETHSSPRLLSAISPTHKITHHWSAHNHHCHFTSATKEFYISANYCDKMCPGKKLVLHWMHCLNTDLLGRNYQFSFPKFDLGFFPFSSGLSVSVCSHLILFTWVFCSCYFFWRWGGEVWQRTRRQQFMFCQ